MESIDTDVLVIGGGLAALRAAIEAARSVKVAVAVKGKLARSGSSAMTTAGYASHIPPELSPETHYLDTIDGGYRLNDPALVRVLTDEAYDRLIELEEFGSTLMREPDGAYTLSPSGDHSENRVVSPVNRLGTDFTVPMAEVATASGVESLEFHAAVDLLIDSGSIAGAVLMNTRTGDLLAVKATAVILATGGAGQLFEVTSNPSGTTGDGYALALRAGARLRDMEMIQFYPWRCVDPFDRSRMPMQPSTFMVGGKLFNRLGERFMAQYNPYPERMEATTRDIGARAIYDQVQKGLGINGGVRLDLSEVDEETFKKTNYKVWRALQTTEIDYRTYPFILTPEAHYVMGGVVIGVNAESNVPGLFAAGEVAGGIQGANRLNSNALPETQVFGQRAGKAAAEFARESAPVGTAEDAIQWWQSRLGGLSRERQSRLKEDRKELKSVAWRTLGIARTESDLNDGLQHVRGLASRLESLHPQTVQEAVDWIELRNLCDFAESSYSSAILRTESRGAHYRSDYPRQNDDDWLKAIVVSKSNTSVSVETAPVETSERLEVRA